jgi:putative transposase
MRRQLVREVRQAHQLSERRACGLFGITRKVAAILKLGCGCDCESWPAVELATAIRRLTVLLQREGWMVNAKPVHRLYRAEGLQMRTKKRRNARPSCAFSCPGPPARTNAGAWIL